MIRNISGKKKGGREKRKKNHLVAFLPKKKEKALCVGRDLYVYPVCTCGLVASDVDLIHIKAHFHFAGAYLKTWLVTINNDHISMHCSP